MSDEVKLKQVCVEFAHKDSAITREFFCEEFTEHNGTLRLWNVLVGGKYFKRWNIPLTAVMFWYENDPSDRPFPGRLM